MKIFLVLYAILQLCAVLISADERATNGMDDNNLYEDDPKRLLVEDYVSTVRDWVPKSDEGVLPIGLTPEEKILQSQHTRLDNQPIRSNIKGRPRKPEFVPEWSPMQGVLISYPLGLSLELIKAMSERAKIFCIVKKNQEEKAKERFRKAGIKSERIEWIFGDPDSYWTRDYGPWFVKTSSSSKGIAIVNHKYNRPRPNDDKVPKTVAKALDVPYYDSKITGCGGNMMVDGAGQASATHIAYTENKKCNTRDDKSVPLDACKRVNKKMKQFFGIDVFNVVADPTNQYIDHIDCWAKYLSPTKILIREVSKRHPQYNDIESVVEYFSNTKTSKGEDWDIVRVWTDSDQPYTNSLILNEEVFVPIVGSKYDEAALDVYKKAMPDYKVSGWKGSWQSTDALHCRTRGIPEFK